MSDHRSEELKRVEVEDSQGIRGKGEGKEGTRRSWEVSRQEVGRRTHTWKRKVKQEEVEPEEREERRA